MCTINLLAILVSFYKDHAYSRNRFELMNYWRWSTLLINTLFLIDLILNLAIVRI